MTPEHLYADGGVVGKNPSTIGGTWAWCHVLAGRRIVEASGVVTPVEIGLPLVTNNLTELLAVLLGLEALPDGWDGRVWTDSLITLERLISKRPLANVPAAMTGRLQATIRRLGAFKVGQVAGHPSNLELALGRRRKGLPVSRFNVWCDEACRMAGLKLKAAVKETA